MTEARLMAGRRWCNGFYGGGLRGSGRTIVPFRPLFCMESLWESLVSFVALLSVGLSLCYVLFFVFTNLLDFCF